MNRFRIDVIDTLQQIARRPTKQFRFDMRRVRRRGRENCGNEKRKR